MPSLRTQLCDYTHMQTWIVHQPQTNSARDHTWLSFFATPLFRPVKNKLKSALIRDKIVNIGQNGPKYHILFAKKYTGLKKVLRR